MSIDEATTTKGIADVVGANHGVYRRTFPEKLSDFIDKYSDDDEDDDETQNESNQTDLNFEPFWRIARDFD